MKVSRIIAILVLMIGLGLPCMARDYEGAYNFTGPEFRVSGTTLELGVGLKFPDGSKMTSVGNFLTNEVDPVFLVAPAASIIDAGSGSVITALERTKVNDSLTVEVDPVFSVAPAASIIDAGSGSVITAGERTDLGLNTIHRTSDGTDHTYINQDVRTTARPSFNGVDFTPEATAPAWLEGRLYYDDSAKTLTMFNDQSMVALNIGREIFRRVKNDTASPIANGTPVYSTGGSDGVTHVAPAISSDYRMSRVFGIATQDIAAGADGEVARLGVIHDIDTSGYTLNDILYLDSTAGQMTTTEPTDGYFKVELGRVTNVSATTGEITMDMVSAVTATEVTDTNGFPADQRTATTITLDEGTRVFTIAPTGADFHFYQEGVQFRKATGVTIEIADTEGLHVVYFDAGTLNEIVNPSDAQEETIIRTKVIVAEFYWDATNNKALYLGDERHGISMSPDTHAYLHFTRGAQFLYGLGLADFVVDGPGSANNEAQFSVAAGAIADEDIMHISTGTASTVGLPVYYRSGASGDWRVDENAGYSFLLGATPLVQFNEWTGATWQLSEATSGNYVLYHIFATNGIVRKVVSIAGQAEYTTSALARIGANNEISSLITSGLPMEEFDPIGTVIFQTKSSYTNSVKARVISTIEGTDYVDWRVTELAQGTPPTDHGNLSGLADDDHTQYHTDARALVWLVGRGITTDGTNGSVSGSWSVGAGITVESSAIFNAGYNAADFTIRKNGSGNAFVYDAGANTFSLAGATTITSGNLTLSSGSVSASGSGTFGSNVTVGSSTADSDQINLLLAKSSGNKWSVLADRATSNHSFRIYNSMTATNAVWIDGVTTNIGIGDNNPTEKLTVAGNISASGSGTFGTGLTATTGNITASGGNVSASGSVTAGSTISTSASSAFVIGDGATEGDWRIIRDGNNLVMQRLESSTWVTKYTITP